MSRPRLSLEPVTAPSAERSATQPVAVEPSARPHDPTLWREWGPFDATVSFKVPRELVEELDSRRSRLREPAGLLMAAALTHLLDQDDETIHSLVDQAEAAKPRSNRRRAPR